MTSLDTAGNDSNTAEIIIPKSVHPIVYTLIANRFCTLAELRDVYDISDALALYEVCAVSAYNRAKMIEGAKRG